MASENDLSKQPRSVSPAPSTKSDKDVPPDPDAANVVPAQHKSQFLQFVKTLASFTGDLSQLTCPAFLLSGTSLLEYSVHWADHPELLARIPAITDPARRMVAVSRWFISTLYGSFHSRCKTGTEKKPYNPVLGEQFLCSWPAATVTNPDGTSLVIPTTNLVCEQVSHHPPVGAFYLDNAHQNIFLNGHCGQKTKFKTTSIKVEQTGRAVLTVHPPNGEVDEYFITLPELVLRGLLTGQLFVELTGTSTITSSSGYLASFEYLPKPWFGGDYHVFKGTIGAFDVPDDLASPDSASSTSSSSSSKKKAKKAKKATAAMAAAAARDASAKPLFTMQGKWTTSCTVTDVATGTTAPLFDAEADAMRTPTVAPLAQQDDLESRKLWAVTTEHLRNGNYAEATASKTAIEDAQRALRKQRAAAGDVWAPKYFAFVADDDAESNAATPVAGSPAGSNLRLDSEQNASPTSLGAASSSSGLSRSSLRAVAVAGAGNAADALTDSGLWTYVGPTHGGK
ncbi:hypothetical protein AMAG_17431 [Allomyces macrogynus ATCC 38327]|uniref:Oxysterol-binding protein n=1 Tax=Allomyces macrogynus (strain ATCC 38327) TaxID=578462 RepID=A0A0L0TEY1_ALLM3|nr:hypothetical protein AMAG_17431 [Allomyces macrogynus ATCC 38327]|eukprot:KNE73255.1 hypothetical protein AMAG_17431 [Allomyces macrogynus ATCC 38327]